MASATITRTTSTESTAWPEVGDETHNASRRSWVSSANGHAEFPIQNLPHGVFSPAGGDPRGGVAIGDRILDMRALAASGLVDGDVRDLAERAGRPTLNAFMAAGSKGRRVLRKRLSALLSEGAAEQGALAGMLHDASGCTMSLPASIGDYTDFYAGIHHATNIGSLLRPDNPLMPNYKYIPIGYNGRTSSILPSGADIIRPNGQRKRPTEMVPSFGPCRNLDYELEVGIWIGSGNQLGKPIAIDEADEHIAGLCLLNDWSARDIQAWEYQPLGPFLAKGFATTISPWLVTAEALDPFRVAQAPRPDGDPAPLDYLNGEGNQKRGGFAIELEVLILTEVMRTEGKPAQRLSLGSLRDLYWTIGQLVTHHASNGCNLQSGDLLGTGTISGHDSGSFGSLMEITRAASTPIALATGETRGFLMDGDEIIMRARAVRDGFVPIGFGECLGRILPAVV